MTIVVILLTALGTAQILSGLDLTPSKGPLQSVDGAFEPDTSFIRKDIAGVTRTLTVTPKCGANESIKEGSIKHSSDIGSTWTPSPNTKPQSLSATGVQSTMKVGAFSKTISGTVITKPGTGEGTPQTLPPAWDFSGTGKYNIIYCNRVSDTSQTLGDTGIKNMTINEKTLYTVSVSSLGRTAKDLIYEIARQAQTTAGGALAKFEILNGLIRTNDNGTKPAGACPVCHNNSLQEISFEIFYENVNGLVSLPTWDFWQSSRACPHIKSQWDSFFAKCKAHELHHANVDFSRDVTANLKTRIGSIKYCSLTSSNTNISPMIIDLQNKLIWELRTNFSDLVNWSTKNSAFDVIDTPLTQPEKFFTEPTHPLYNPCGRP